MQKKPERGTSVKLASKAYALKAHPNIHFLKRSDIDTALWNACIEQAPNGLPYAHTTFLDAMCSGWSALVQDDYDAVMPLPQRKKWGIPYLYQPFLTPVLGVFSKSCGAINTDTFLKAIPVRYRLWDLSLNSANTIHAYNKWAIARTNYLLTLNGSYASIRLGYHQNTTHNLLRASKAKLELKTAIAVDEIMAIAANQYTQFTKVEKGAFERVKSLCKSWHNHIRTYGVYSKEGRLLASCIFLLFGNRLVYWLPANSLESRTCGASHFLTDRVINEFAGQEIVLDFEGSDDAGVARFYQAFGALPEKYTTIYNNKLPYPFSYLKRLPEHYRQLVYNNKQKDKT